MAVRAHITTDLLASPGQTAEANQASIGLTNLAHIKGNMQPAAVGLDWSAFVVVLHHVSVLLIGSYMTHTIGMSGINLIKLGQIGSLILQVGLPFIIMGDQNMPPNLWDQN